MKSFYNKNKDMESPLSIFKISESVKKETKGIALKRYNYVFFVTNFGKYHLGICQIWQGIIGIWNPFSFKIVFFDTKIA